MNWAMRCGRWPNTKSSIFLEMLPLSLLFLLPKHSKHIFDITDFWSFIWIMFRNVRGSFDENKNREKLFEMHVIVDSCRFCRFRNDTKLKPYKWNVIRGNLSMAYLVDFAIDFLFFFFGIILNEFWNEIVCFLKLLIW